MGTQQVFRNPPDRGTLKREASEFGIKNPLRLEGYMAFMSAAGEVMSLMDSLRLPGAVSQARVRILMQLKREPGFRLAPSAIARRMGLKKATVTGLAERLERDGYLKRERNTGDRRFSMAFLTPAGLRLIKKTIPVRYGAMEKVMSVFSDSEIKKLIKMMDAVKKSVDGVKNPADGGR